MRMRKKQRKNKNININQNSFFFEDYVETNRKNKYSQKTTSFKIEFIYYFSCLFH